MLVSLKLIATYRKLLPPEADGNRIEIDIPAETTISALLEKFNVPQDESSVILLNGAVVPLSSVLAEGDKITAFSAIAGG